MSKVTHLQILICFEDFSMTVRLPLVLHTPLEFVELLEQLGFIPDSRSAGVLDGLDTEGDIIEDWPITEEGIKYLVNLFSFEVDIDVLQYCPAGVVEYLVDTLGLRPEPAQPLADNK